MNVFWKPVFTVGHSTHTLNEFVGLLQRQEITTVADVRSAPYSRFNPQFNRDVLEKQLVVRGIKYVFLGRELGARSEDRDCYENGRVIYGRLAGTEIFRQGIERVVQDATEDRVVLMCAEKDPLECHRTLLVAPALTRLGIAVHHILADGRLESHRAAMERLLDVVGLGRGDLFRSVDELIVEAIGKQEQRVAYVDQRLAAQTARERR